MDPGRKTQSSKHEVLCGAGHSRGLKDKSEEQNQCNDFE